jgi:2,3-dimethylmalate lyase
MSASKASELRALLGNGTLMVPACYDGITAAILEDVGFRAIGVSGAGLAMSQLGAPDLGLLTLTELVTAVRQLAARRSVPLLVDADTGFGGALNVYRTVEELVAVGAAAIQLEDQVAPKRCGHLTGKDVVDSTEFIERIRAAVVARGSADTLIVARTDALAVHGIEEAMQRCRRAFDAGAEVLFVEAPTTMNEVERIAELPGFAMYNLAAGGHSPQLTIAELSALGYALVVCPTVALYAAVAAVRDAAVRLHDTGSDAHLEELAMSPKALFETVGLSGWLTLDRQISAGAHP